MLMLDLRTCLLAAMGMLLGGAVLGSLISARIHGATGPHVPEAEMAVSVEQATGMNRPPDVAADFPVPSETSTSSESSSQSSTASTRSLGRRFSAWLVTVLVAPFAFRGPIRDSLRKESNYENASLLGIWTLSTSGLAWLMWASSLPPWLSLLSVAITAFTAIIWFALFCSKVIHWLGDH